MLSGDSLIHWFDAHGLFLITGVILVLALAGIGFFFLVTVRKTGVRHTVLTLSGIVVWLLLALSFLLDTGVFGESSRLWSLVVRTLAAIVSLIFAISLLRNRWRILRVAQLTRTSATAHREIEQQRTFLRTVLEGESESILACDDQGRITLINRAGRELFNESILSTSPEDWPESYHLYEADGVTPLYWRNVPLLRALNGAVLTNVSMKVIPPGKPARMVRVVRATPMRDKAGRKIGAICIQEDVTEQVRLQEKSERWAREVEKLRHERTASRHFLSSITHDLRNPLGAARSAIRILKRNPESLAERERLIFRIERNLDRTDRMLTDLLDANRIESGAGLAVEFVQMDLVEVVKGSLEELVLVYGDRFSLDAPERILGFWSPEGVRRVLENLVSNAVKYGHETREITIRLEEAESEAILSVHNFGAFIPEEERRALFRAFHRSGHASRTQKGWGIGLTVVKGVVEAHRGRVEIESEAEKGTRFSVFFPLDAREL